MRGNDGTVKPAKTKESLLNNFYRYLVSGWLVIYFLCKCVGAMLYVGGFPMENVFLLHFNGSLLHNFCVPYFTHFVQE
jgi:hypothetical protein